MDGRGKPLSDSLCKILPFIRQLASSKGKKKERRGHIYRAKYTAGIFVDVAIMSAISVILREGKMLR